MRFVRHRINNLDTRWVEGEKENHEELRRFEKIQNELYRLLYGRETMPARWTFCIAYVNGWIFSPILSLFKIIFLTANADRRP